MKQKEEDNFAKQYFFIKKKVKNYKNNTMSTTHINRTRKLMSNECVTSHTYLWDIQGMRQTVALAVIDFLKVARSLARALTIALRAF